MAFNLSGILSLEANECTESPPIIVHPPGIIPVYELAYIPPALLPKKIL